MLLLGISDDNFVQNRSSSFGLIQRQTEYWTNRQTTHNLYNSKDEEEILK